MDNNFTHDLPNQVVAKSKDISDVDTLRSLIREMASYVDYTLGSVRALKETQADFLRDNQRFRHQHAQDVKEIERRTDQAIENRLRAEKAEAALSTAEKHLHSALLLAQYGEDADGNDDTWPQWGDRVERFLRRDEESE